MSLIVGENTTTRTDVVGALREDEGELILRVRRVGEQDRGLGFILLNVEVPEVNLIHQTDNCQQSSMSVSL